VFDRTFIKFLNFSNLKTADMMTTRAQELRAASCSPRPGSPGLALRGGRTAFSQLESLRPQTGLRAAELVELGRARAECVALRVLVLSLRREAVCNLGAEELRTLRDEVEDAIGSLEQRRAAEDAVGQLHADFCCPINGVLMQEPVLLIEDGHTYDSQAIEAYFRGLVQNNKPPSSPLTRAVLGSTRTVANLCVKKAISAAVQTKLAQQRAEGGAGAKRPRAE
jgi:hypothetical protein